jgi:hypothetical protein
MNKILAKIKVGDEKLGELYRVYYEATHEGSSICTQYSELVLEPNFKGLWLDHVMHETYFNVNVIR